MYCIFCGAYNSDNATFCCSCGRNISKNKEQLFNQFPHRKSEFVQLIQSEDSGSDDLSLFSQTLSDQLSAKEKQNNKPQPSVAVAKSDVHELQEKPVIINDLSEIDDNRIPNNLQNQNIPESNEILPEQQVDMVKSSESDTEYTAFQSNIITSESPYDAENNIDENNENTDLFDEQKGFDEFGELKYNAKYSINVDAEKKKMIIKIAAIIVPAIIIVGVCIWFIMR